MGSLGNSSTRRFVDILYFFTCVILIFLLTAYTATAHDWLSKYNTPKGADCCGIKDCKPLPAGSWVKIGDRVVVFPGMSETKITIIHPSQDGKVWVCITGCAFMPSLG